MLESDFLTATAEVSIAFTGFSGLVAIYSSPQIGAWTSIDSIRLRILLSYSLSALFASLVPFLFYHAGVDERLVWRASSGIFGLITFVIVFLGWSWTRRHQTTAATRLGNLVGVGLILMILLLLLNAAGFIHERVSWLYLFFQSY